MTLDLARIRADFPALSTGAAFFDSPGGTQTPQVVIDAICGSLQAPLSNRGTSTEAQRNAEEIVLGARRALADLLGVDAGSVVLGRSATALTFEMSRTLARCHSWSAGDEVVVTRLDHDANVRPWLIAAERAGATVRFADFDPTSGELPPEAVTSVLSDRTRLVAVTAASNLIGTMPDITAIAAAVHDAGALLFVDAVHYAAHAHVDLAVMGADLLVCSPYKFFGPHHGVLAAAPGLLETLWPDKLLPSSNAVPERFELGTLPYEMLAGTTAAVDYLAGLLPAPGTGRRERLAVTHAEVARHELGLRQRLEAGLDELGATRYSRARQRTSTVLFSLPDRSPGEVAAQLAERGVNAPAGHFYAIETSRHLGLGDHGGVRVGLALYNDEQDVDRLLTELTALA